MKKGYILTEGEFTLLSKSVLGKAPELCGEFTVDRSELESAHISEGLERKRYIYKMGGGIKPDPKLAECFVQLSNAKYAAFTDDRELWVYYCPSAVVMIRREGGNEGFTLTQFKDVPESEEYLNRLKARVHSLIFKKK